MNPFSATAGVLAVFLLLGASPASHAGDAPGERIEISPIRAGQLLFRAGRIRDAHKLLERARPENEEERIERLFLLGLIDARLGSPRRAAQRFEAILAQRPELTRVRLELARVYHTLGLDEKARFHFESSLADELPSSVETAVEGFLNRIDARKRWSLSLSTAVVPESNPGKRTGREQVRIGGIPFRLNPDARESSGVGYLVTTGASFAPALADDLRGVFAVSSAAKLYKQPDWNDVSLHGEIGLARLFDRGIVSGGLRLGRRWLAADPYSREIGPWMARAAAPVSRKPPRGESERGEPGPRQSGRSERLAVQRKTRMELRAAAQRRPSRRASIWNSPAPVNATTPTVWPDWASPSRMRSGAGSPSRRACRPMSGGTPGRSRFS